MKKQPTLPNFPSHILATSKRIKQAQIQKAKNEFSKNSLSGYAELFSDVLPNNFMEGLGKTKRVRHYDFLSVFWAWFAQIISGNSSCTVAVSLIQSWNRTRRLPIASSDNSAYCRGRKRLCSDALEQVNEQILAKLVQRVQPKDLWFGHQLLAIDGTSVRLMDTEKNQEKYPQPKGQKKDCGFPVMGVVALTNLSHGGIVDTATCGHEKHDARIAQQLLGSIDKDDVLLADRAFCSYELTCRITINQEANYVMRLHQARFKKLDWRKGKKLSGFERLITWKKPKKQPSTSDLTSEQWDALPDEQTVRYIKMGYETRNGEKKMLVVVTNLLDPIKYPGEEVIDLYAERWRIEVQFRDIKSTMKMEQFDVKSPHLAKLTLQMLCISYNLIRSVMQRASVGAEKPVRELSFQGVRTVLLSSYESFQVVRGKPILKSKLYESMLQNCAEHLIDIRPNRHEPRARKLRPKAYPLLHQSRTSWRAEHGFKK